VKRLVATVVVLVVVVVVVCVGGSQLVADQMTSAGEPPSGTPTPVAGAGARVIRARGHLEPARTERVGFTAGAKVAQVLAQAGDVVSAGQVLARLDTAEMEAQVRKAQDALALAQAQLRQAQAQATPKSEEIELAKVELERAQIALRQAQAAYDRIAWRGDAALSPEAGALEQATLNCRAAQATYRLKIRQPQDSDFEVYEWQVKQAETNLALAEAELGKAELRAPFAGTVTQVDVVVGGLVSAGAPAFVLSAGMQVQTTDLDEEGVAVIQVGQPVTVTILAFEDKVVPGTIRHIAPQATKLASGDVAFPVIIALDQPDEALRWGMTVRVRFK
jgi:HlyD family secretion protein